MENLNGLKVAILIADGFEQVEMVKPRQALQEAGAETSIVSPKQKTVRGWQFKEWGDEFPVDLPLDNADPENFDALLLPGGVMNPDHLRMLPTAVDFVKSFFDSGKPVAPWPALKTDLRNAGAEWVDEQVVNDGNLVSSRKPDDIPAFNRGMIDLFSRYKKQARPAA
jgi:protease I